MTFRLAVLLLPLSALGCGGTEPERSRVVPAGDAPAGASAAPDRPAPGPVRKIEMH